MFGKTFVSALIATAMLISPTQRATAGESIVGGIIGGIIGGVIANDTKNKRRKKAVVQRKKTCGPKCRAKVAARAHNRETQVALNYFGYDAGTPDGVVGKGTRAAVSRFQTSMGYAPSGYIQENERAFLVSSYHRGIAGAQVGSPQLLASFKQPNNTGTLVGAPDAQPLNQQPQQAAIEPPKQPQPQPQPQQQSTTQVIVQTQPSADVPVEEVSQGLAALNFLGATPQISMTNHCNRTSLITNSNGGFVNVSNITDASFALDEQFCLARTYMITASEQMLASAQGVSTEHVQKQCEAFAPAMRPYASGIVSKPIEQSLSELQAYVASTGMNPAALAANSKVCLGLGYRVDDPEVALASALVLVGLGETSYTEMLGHHVLNGFGTSARTDRAVDWYKTAVMALEQGVTPVVSPGNTQRPALLKMATLRLAGSGGTKLADPVTPVSAIEGLFSMPSASSN